VKDIHDVIKHTKFGDDRLRGSGVVAGQISAFPIDFAGRAYNTLTLPCERVIIIFIIRSFCSRVSCFLMFFSCFLKMFLVGLATGCAVVFYE